MKLHKPENISKFVYWTPRILSILFILFLMMFSLDVFEPGLSAKEIAIGLFMHNIPALILLIVTIISWKHEIVGGIIFILAGLLYIIVLITNPFEWYMLAWSLQIAGPSFFIGILFILNWRKKRSFNQTIANN
jgi:hypothetical protein